jgi:hypothetical protein
MKLVMVWLIFSMLFLTACGKNTDMNSTPETTETPGTTEASETTETTQATTTETTETVEQPFEIKLNDDSMKDPYGVAINSQGHICE